MKRMAEFQRVSQVVSGMDPADIILPARATEDSAGYDFYAPFSFTLNPGEGRLVPTGIRVRMEKGYVLMLFPRSGLGFKYRLRLDNTVGVIDGDYYRAENEGHIMVKLKNEGELPLCIQKGAAFCQGVFLPYGITYDDDVAAVRAGGFGSTDQSGQTISRR